MSTPEQEEVREAFFHHFRNRPPLTMALLATIVLMYAASLGWDLQDGRALPRVLTMGPSNEALLALGARDADLVEDGHFNLLFTSVLLHGDLLHLGLNSAALFGLGRLVEAVWGPGRTLFLFAACGLGGSLLAQAGGTPLSIGASGAIFGWMGAAVVFGLMHKRELPLELRGFFGRGLAPWVAVNLSIGIAPLLVGMRTPIDNLGHLGGLVAGLVLAPILSDRVIPTSRPRSWVGPVLGGLGGAALALALLAQVA